MVLGGRVLLVVVLIELETVRGVAMHLLSQCFLTGAIRSYDKVGSQGTHRLLLFYRALAVGHYRALVS